MSPGRGGPPRDFRDGPGPGRGSPRGGMMGGRGPGGRRSRSRSPPRNGNGFGPDQRPGSAGPRSPPRGPGQRSPPRGGFDGRGPGGPPPFDDRGRGPFPMGRPPSPMRGGGFGPRPDGPPNMFPPRGRSRSPNRPPPGGDMMRKRDRSWERGGPPPDMMRRPFNGPGGLPDSPRMMEPRPYDTPSEWNFELKRSGKVKCRCSATSLSVGLNRQLPLYLDVVALPHLNKSAEFLQLERPNVRRVVYELKPESMADSRGYREFVDYLIQGRGGHARAGGAAEMDPQGFKVFILPPGQAARQLGYKGDHMIVVLRSR
ncbi:hypothetical protein F444_04103 [Phytophthora nicotianae P1976]|nr:hypothetical protein F444_04103 [Phytophthora nicotianae P1976]